jgi:hypothetical protein
MRSSASTQLVGEEGQKPISILLEHNWCSEHEHGVSTLRRRCGGMSDEEANNKRVCDFSRIRIKPEDVIWYEEKGLAVLGIDDLRFRNWNFSEKDLKRYKLKIGDPVAKAWAAASYDLGIPKKLTKKDLTEKWKPRQTHSAWDESSFGIVSREPEIIEFLKLLKDAMLKGDAVLHISTTGNPFKPVSGLLLGIESLVPQEMKDGFKAGYENIYKLKDAAEKTGIAKRLEQAKKRHYCLDPKWSTEIKSTKNGEIKTTYPVIFWLNPCEQHIYDAGWYTVEQLDQWIKNEGIILKANKPVEVK